MAHSITTVKARAALKPRISPYWHPIARGCHLGFRKTGPAAPGTWVTKFRDDDGKELQHSLGGFDDIPPSEHFDAARKKAADWFEHMGRGGSSEEKSLKDICEAYVAHLANEGRAGASKDAAGRFKRWIYSNPKLAGTPVQKLTQKQVDDWRKKLRATLAIPQDKEKAATRPRAEGSINRDMTTLRAALNLALENGDVTSDHAWKAKLKPIENADGRRDVYLDQTQRRKLIDKAPADLALFLTALCLLPLRPGAVAALNAGHFDKQLSSLTIGKDKAGGIRKITLPPATATFFAERSKDKLPAAPLFVRADGKRWDKDAWKVPIKDAVVAAELPAAVTAYTLRHSTITDLVNHGLPTLTVAQLSGTSVAMVEKHYGHLQQKQSSAALAMLAI